MEKNRPLIVELDEAKTAFIEFIQTLQSRGIPCYLIDMALADVFAQVKNVARAELDAARKSQEEDNKDEQ
jgi:hypothetical protein